ncbi:hypothetical protein K493DRAFT_307891 [Basidiobolus meristosporus CBS 931.73]|uniref:Uncharacterized protein n=1 Tax=Basidiobolus meristosporus CBS 931.73 TaxID=1314790 RepID=A0A1Y1X9S2_9FUNG|nr:hypothetical protein K493DRAFT_307891 [Basidiobolus meristosporus CBS 931.73]|eukprot:ORX82166.1 hypothetical protein K493DRAFT_307891 [Basidiobolus meristosporus CBS 931.73]
MDGKSASDLVTFDLECTAFATMIMAHRCFSVTPLRHVYGICAVTLQVVKLGGIIMFYISLRSMIGKFGECVAVPDPSAFVNLLISELALNSFMLAWWIPLVASKIYHNPRKFAKSFGEDGAGYTMFSAVSTIFFFTCVYNGFSFGLNPEVLMQSKWATESKMCVAQLEALAKELKRGKKSGGSKIHSLSPGWTCSSSKKSNHGIGTNERPSNSSVV